MTASAVTTPHPWALGDRQVVADFHPPLSLYTVAVGSSLGLAGAAVLWSWSMPALATLALLATAMFAAGCFYLPLDHVAVGRGWVANGPLHRPVVVDAEDVRSIEMPELLDLGVPVLKLLTGDHTVRVDVNTLYRNRVLGTALLDVIDLALFHGAELDREADETIGDLRIRHR